MSSYLRRQHLSFGTEPYRTHRSTVCAEPNPIRGQFPSDKLSKARGASALRGPIVSWSR